MLILKNSARIPHPENIECVTVLTVSLEKLFFVYFELQLKVEKWVNDNFNVFRLTGPSGMYPLVFRELIAHGGGKMLKSWGAFFPTTSRKKARLGYVQGKSVHIRQSVLCPVLFGGFTSLYCNNVLTEHTDNVILTNSINDLETIALDSAILV